MCEVTPAERLKEIEEKIYQHNDHEMCDGISELFETDLPWLIARVKRLTEALEKIGNYPPSDNQMHITIGFVECRGIARKALESEDG